MDVQESDTKEVMHPVPFIGDLKTDKTHVWLLGTKSQVGLFLEDTDRRGPTCWDAEIFGILIWVHWGQ